MDGLGSSVYINHALGGENGDFSVDSRGEMLGGDCQRLRTLQLRLGRSIRISEAAGIHVGPRSLRAILLKVGINHAVYCEWLRAVVVFDTEAAKHSTIWKGVSIWRCFSY